MRLTKVIFSDCTLIYVSGNLIVRLQCNLFLNFLCSCHGTVYISVLPQLCVLSCVLKGLLFT